VAAMGIRILPLNQNVWWAMTVKNLRITAPVQNDIHEIISCRLNFTNSCYCILVNNLASRALRFKRFKPIKTEWPSLVGEVSDNFCG
jgi:hypothetical protein